MEKVKCKHCGKEYSKHGIGTHIWRNHSEGKTHDPNKNRIAWNKGLTKETDERVKKTGESLKGNAPWIKGRKHTKKSKLKMRESALKSFKEGTHATWQTRNIESYPEKYFKRVLENLSLTNYEFNHPIKNDEGKTYFLDFYFSNGKIDLEIDGSQHKLPERIESDKKRDKFLEKEGIKVFRIDWKNPKTKKGKGYLEEKIKELFDLYMRK